MSYHTLSLITTCLDKRDFVRISEYLEEHVKQCSIREIYFPFQGIVCQIDLKQFDWSFTDCIVELSKDHSDKNIAIINLECFAGQCVSSGEVYNNGIIILKEEYSWNSHMKLLLKVSEKYTMWHFEPFTRDYFIKKIGFWGEIRGEAFGVLATIIYSEYNDKANFNAQFSRNELTISNEVSYFYLMEPCMGCIKVLGSIHENVDENLNYVKDIIESYIVVTKSYIIIEDIENGEYEKIINWGEEDLTETSYRHMPFNLRPLDYPSETPAFPDNVSDNNDKTDKKGFWNNVKKLFNN